METPTPDRSVEEIVEKFRKNHSEKCDGVHAGWCGGEKISDHTNIIIEDLRTSLTRIQQETVRLVVEEIQDIANDTPPNLLLNAIVERFGSITTSD